MNISNWTKEEIELEIRRQLSVGNDIAASMIREYAAHLSRQFDDPSEEEWERAWRVFKDPQSGQNSRTRMTDEMYSVLSDFVARRAALESYASRHAPTKD